MPIFNFVLFMVLSTALVWTLISNVRLKRDVREYQRRVGNLLAHVVKGSNHDLGEYMDLWTQHLQLVRQLKVIERERDDALQNIELVVKELELAEDGWGETMTDLEKAEQDIELLRDDLAAKPKAARKQ